MWFQRNSIIYNIVFINNGVTGRKYQVLDLSIINTRGYGTNVFPGSTDGTVDSSSVYH